MIVRTRSGECVSGGPFALLDFLGVKREAAGVHKVADGVEVIADVKMSNEELGMRGVKCQVSSPEIG